MVDVPTHKVLNTVSLAYDPDVKPVEMAVTTDGTRIYVANGCEIPSRCSTLPAYRYKRRSRSGSVFGASAFYVRRASSPANGLSNNVSVVDTNTNSVVATVPAGEGPWGIAIRE